MSSFKKKKKDHMSATLRDKSRLRTLRDTHDTCIRSYLIFIPNDRCFINTFGGSHTQKGLLMYIFTGTKRGVKSTLTKGGKITWKI